MNKKFTLQFDFEGNIGPIKSTVEDLKKSLSGVKLPDSFATGLEKTFGRLAAEFDNFEAIVKSGFDDLASVSKAEKSFGKIITLVNQLSIQTGQIEGIDPKKLIPKESLERFEKLEKALSEVHKEANKKSTLAKEIEEQTKELEKQEKVLGRLKDRRSEYAARNRTLGAQKGTKTAAKNAAEARRAEVATAMGVLEAQKGGKSTAEYKALSSEYSDLSSKIKGLDSDLRRINAQLDENQVEMAALAVQVDQAAKSYDEIKAGLDNLKNIQITPKGLVELRGEVAKLTNTNIDQVPQDLEELQTVINNLKEEELVKVAQALQKIKEEGANVPQAVIPAKESLLNLAETGSEMQRTANEIDNLKNQVLDFFSIGNSIQLFKRAITSAMNTVKELDATMTEAAVVTEFDIGDMWERLPEYSDQAKELGVSINSMYQATTLYYQQGLKTNEAMELGVETMKMAKIAGIDSANATKAMTSALRGFNMELNETSAQRVNDVYSQLAAVTAADTNQIATAMEKTASIAASANMEFETTAAFLSQIIETTQEAPETAGTALKTIIARFAEVKSLREQGLTSGEDTEGEIIDVNKIQTALRTVGISMEGFFAGTEGLDDVLLKLAEKWGSLDFETQRYIATMAAGSRQQSRFIAMMSDYQRTAELVSEANNSAGASQKQYEKTLDSLETKLQNLKNAWDEFAMGLANNELLKAGVDILTGLLNVVNKTTEAISGGNGLVKSVASLAMVLSTLKIGKSILGGTEAGGAIGGILGRFGLASKGEDGERKSIWAIPGERAAERKAVKEVEGGGVFQKPKIAKNVVGFTYSDQDKKNLKDRLTRAANKQTDPQKRDELLKLRASLDETGADVDKVKNKFGELGGNIKKLGTETKETALDLDNVGASMSKLGGIMMATGAATSLLATLFDSMGMEEEAETVRTLGAVLMGLGTVLTTLGSFLPTLTGLTAAQAAATWAALWPILLVVAALGALVAAIVLIAKHQYDISLEGRMEAAAEATERAKEAAEDAKEAYDQLLEDKTGYDDLQNKLDTLTKGTLEWKQALADSNAQVLKLLDTYPELAKYLTRGQHGELEITEDGWDYIQKQQEQEVRSKQSEVISSQRDETVLQEEELKENLYEIGLEFGLSRKGKKRVKGKGGRRRGGTVSVDVVDEEDIEAIYTKYKEAPDIFESNELDAFAESIGRTASQVLAMKDAIVQYDEGLLGIETIKQAQTEALLANNVSTRTINYEYSDELIAGFARSGAAGQDVDQAAAIMQNLSKSMQKLYAMVISGDASRLALGEIGKLNEIGANEIIKFFGFEEGSALANQVEEFFSRTLKDAETTYAGNKNTIIKRDDWKNKDSKLLDAASNKALKNLDQMLAYGQVYGTGEKGSSLVYEAIDFFGEAFENEFKEAGDGLEKLMDGLAAYDLTQQGQLEEFLAYARALGVTIDETDEETRNYLTQLKALSAATQDLSFDNAVRNVQAGFNEAAEVQKKASLSWAEYQDYVSRGLIESESEWSWNGEGWVNITSGMDDLAQVIRENTIAQYEQAKALLQDKIARYGQISEKIEGATTIQPSLIKKAPEGSSLLDLYGYKEVADTALINALNSGKATEEQWSKFFIDEKEYKDWLTFNASDADADIKNYEKWINSLKLMANQAYGDTSHYEEYYSEYEKIAELARERERLERQRNDLLRKGNAEEAKLKRQEQIKKLGEERKEQQGIVYGKKQQINELLADPKYQSIINKTGIGYSFETGEIAFDEAAANAMSTSQQAIFDELKKKLEDFVGQYEEAEDALLEKEGELYDYYREDLDAYIDTTKEIKDAMATNFEKEIDALSEVNDSINDANAKLVEELQSSVEKYRQDRENERAESDIEDKQRRLAYLQQNPAGNAAEILKLQKEIADDQEAHTDNLIDQKIQDLQDQNDKAAEQREQQIQIARDQLEYWKNNDANAEIKDALAGAFVNGQLNESSSLVRDMRSAAGYDKMSDEEKEAFDLDLKQRLGVAQTFSAYGVNGFEAYLADWLNDNAYEPPKEPELLKWDSTYKKPKDWGNIRPDHGSSDDIKGLQFALKALTYYDGPIGGTFGNNTQAALKAFQSANGLDPDGKCGPKTREKLKSLFAYKTGGLADFTGPAWLDGTKSRPEYILSADQTQAFFSLVDVLQGLRNGNTQNTQNNGDMAFDIDINVESIGDKIDLDTISQYVEQKIVASANYRNNNLIGRTR